MPMTMDPSSVPHDMLAVNPPVLINYALPATGGKTWIGTKPT